MIITYIVIIIKPQEAWPAHPQDRLATSQDRLATSPEISPVVRSAIQWPRFLQTDSTRAGSSCFSLRSLASPGLLPLLVAIQRDRYILNSSLSFTKVLFSTSLSPLRSLSRRGRRDGVTRAAPTSAVADLRRRCNARHPPDATSSRRPASSP
jgi:hypothetical protein